MASFLFFCQRAGAKRQEDGLSFAGLVVPKIDGLAESREQAGKKSATK